MTWAWGGGLKSILRPLVLKLLIDLKPPPPSNFIAGRPKASLLFWFFGDFRCGVSLFIVILAVF